MTHVLSLYIYQQVLLLMDIHHIQGHHHYDFNLMFFGKNPFNLNTDWF